jgi:tetratricopeptide (TPR) repeat protein
MERRLQDVVTQCLDTPLRAIFMVACGLGGATSWYFGMRGLAALLLLIAVLLIGGGFVNELCLRRTRRLEAQEQYREAISWGRRALVLSHLLYGRKSLTQGISLITLAQVYQIMGRWTEAEPLYLQARKVYSSMPAGEVFPGYFTVLFNLAALYQAMGRWAEAEPLYLQFKELYSSWPAYVMLSATNPTYADSLHKLARRCQAMGRWREAEPLYLQIKELYSRALGEQHSYYASSLNDLAMLYVALGRWEEAEPLYLQVKELYSQVMDEQAQAYASKVNNLVMQYQSIEERRTEAEPLHLQTQESYSQAMDGQAPAYAESLNALAMLYQTMGRWTEAEPLYLQVKELYSRVLGEQTLNYATILNNLATLYQTMERQAEAESLYLQAQEICSRVVGEQHLSYADNLYNLATLYTAMGRWAEAEPLYLQAQEILSRVVGKQHPYYANCLNGLAQLYGRTERWMEAEPLYLQAQEIWSRVVGKQHPSYANSLHNLALLYQVIGRWKEAESLHLQVQGIYSQAVSGQHPTYATSLDLLGTLLVAMGRYEEALQTTRKGIDIHNRLLVRLAAALPEQQVLAFAQRWASQTSTLLTLVGYHKYDSADAVQIALDLVLARKAIAYEAAATQHTVALGSSYPELQTNFAQLRGVRTELARGTLSGPTYGETVMQYEARMHQLEHECEQLERLLASQVPEVELQRRLQAADRVAIAQALPVEAILVEFLRIQLDNFSGPSEERERYMAFTMPAGAPEKVQIIDLGEAQALDRLIAKFRAVITGEAPTQEEATEVLWMGPEESCRHLYDQLFAPLVARWEHVHRQHDLTHLVIAPDGELCQVPFGALLSPTGRFVIEDYLISYVTVGRDVVQFGMPEVKSSGAVIIADPDYDLGAVPVTVKAAEGEECGGTPTALNLGSTTRAPRHQSALRHLQHDVERFNRLPGHASKARWCNAYSKRRVERWQPFGRTRLPWKAG